MSLATSVADGSGMTHEGSNSWICLRLGTIDDFRPDGARIMKLWAKAGLFSSFRAK